MNANNRINRLAIATFFMVLPCVGSPCASFGCTVFCAVRNGTVLVGNNEDYFNPRTRIWFEPATDEQYGHVLFGWENEYDIPMGGMNEKGLVFDWLAVPGFIVGAAAEQDPYHRLSEAVHHMMATCDSVDGVLALLEGVEKSGRWEAVLFVSDVHGNAVVVEGDQIVRKDPNKDFFVATNFRQSAVHPNAVTCVRHKLVTSLLGSNADIGIELFRDALNATHAESPAATLYSNVYEPQSQRIHLFHFHDFHACKVLDLKTELGKGKRVVDLSSLFEPNVAAQAFASATMRNDAPSAVPLSRPARDYIGTFGSDAYHIEIRGRHEELWAYPSLGLRSQLIPTGEDHFSTDRLGTHSEYEFYSDRNGNVSLLLLRRNGRITTLRKRQQSTLSSHETSSADQ